MYSEMLLRHSCQSELSPDALKASVLLREESNEFRRGANSDGRCTMYNNDARINNIARGSDIKYIFIPILKDNFDLQRVSIPSSSIFPLPFEVPLFAFAKFLLRTYIPFISQSTSSHSHSALSVQTQTFGPWPVSPSSAGRA